MGLLKITPGRQYLVQRCDSLGVCEVPGGAPQNPGRRQMALGQRRIERPCGAAVVLGPFQPATLRIEAVKHIDEYVGEPRVRQSDARLPLSGAGRLFLERQADPSNFRGDRR